MLAVTQEPTPDEEEAEEKDGDNEAASHDETPAGETVVNGTAPPTEDESTVSEPQVTVPNGSIDEPVEKTHAEQEAAPPESSSETKEDAEENPQKPQIKNDEPNKENQEEEKEEEFAKPGDST